MTTETRQLTLYEPRWHGFAKWTLERLTYQSADVALVEVLESGWVRRPKGSQFVQMDEILSVVEETVQDRLRATKDILGWRKPYHEHFRIVQPPFGPPTTENCAAAECEADGCPRTESGFPA